MTTLRDDFLSVVDELRGLPGEFGFRRFTVVLRRRIWSGTYVGDGSITNVDLTITPLPRVRQSFSPRGISPMALEYILQNGNVISDRLYMIDRITPFYGTGGWLSEQLRMRPSPDAPNVEPVVILVGDDGYARDCVQLTLEQDRALGYTMLVKESDRPRAALSSLTVATIPAIVHGLTEQLSATGTFADGEQSNVTPLAKWSSSNTAVARVDILGRLTAVAAGTASITATLSGVASSAKSVIVT